MTTVSKHKIRTVKTQEYGKSNQLLLKSSQHHRQCIAKRHHASDNKHRNAADNNRTNDSGISTESTTYRQLLQCSGSTKQPDRRDFSSNAISSFRNYRSDERLVLTAYTQTKKQLIFWQRTIHEWPASVQWNKKPAKRSNLCTKHSATDQFCCHKS